MRYEFIGGGSRKFWEINKPVEVDGDWGVTVTFGRIGQWSQPRTHACNSKWEADRYYEGKVDEKLKKGYVLKTPHDTTISSKLVGLKQAAVQKSGVVFKPCLHDSIARKGNVWECMKCKASVDFAKPKAESEIAAPEFKKKVRRFFDLRPNGRFFDLRPNA